MSGNNSIHNYHKDIPIRRGNQPLGSIREFAAKRGRPSLSTVLRVSLAKKAALIVEHPGTRKWKNGREVPLQGFALV